MHNNFDQPAASPEEVAAITRGLIRVTSILMIGAIWAGIILHIMKGN